MAAAACGLIIGAGPYGLSLAAHLAASRTRFRIVGTPMAPWRSNMPGGMFLKSEGFASNLHDPAGACTLATFCAEHGIPYADTGLPVSVETFVAYGEWFQRRQAPALEDRTVTRLRRAGDLFEAICGDGVRILAPWVVIASGITCFAHMPAQLGSLPDELVSHAADHHDFGTFSGREVAVIGGGASAADVAAALQAAGARTTIVTRRDRMRFQVPLGDRSWLDRLRAPMTPLGPGWKSVLCTHAPLLFHVMPDGFRTDVVRRYLGAAPGWFTRSLLEGKVPVVAGATVSEAAARDGRAALVLRHSDGRETMLLADHVIAATGYRVDVARIPYLDPALAGSVRTVGGAPRLSRHFESSVSGLYFTGTAAANSFGPMLRFAAGAGFAARRIARRLAAAGRSTHVAARPEAEPVAVRG
ncbi:MAG: NAD(P)-binding domain-containing protein [Proteobacteria bacterium]|nr:NAD(P)-binding domain-containing protein [Pseudomonadota bacterium]